MNDQAEVLLAISRIVAGETEARDRQEDEQEDEDDQR
jgi:hypothetical protein